MGQHPLKGMTLKGSAFGIKPFLDADLATMSVKGGVQVDVFEMLAKHYGFKHDVKYASNWITMAPDGALGGALGEERQTQTKIQQLLICYS